MQDFFEKNSKKHKLLMNFDIAYICILRYHNHFIKNIRSITHHSSSLSWAIRHYYP